MKIKEIFVDGFKNLSNVKIKFDSITALISLNNLGKSNVLSAIDFGINFIKSSIKEKSDMMSDKNLIPINKHMVEENYKFEIKIETEFQNIEYILIYGYEFEWNINENYSPSIINEYLKMRPKNSKQKYTKIINRTDKIRLYKSCEKGRCSSSIKIEPKELILNKLQAYDELFYLDIIKKLNNINFYMENHFDSKAFYFKTPIIRKGFDDITIDFENLPRVIYQLNKKEPEKFELLKNIYINLFPNIEDIIIKQYEINLNDDENLPSDLPFIISKSVYVLFVKDKNLITPIDFSMMSDGAKRVFMVLTKIILADIQNISLIAIEEPENSVHPSLLQSYIQIISQISNNCKIIITSHSPYIISYLEPSWIYIGINKKTGIANFFKLSKSGKTMLEKDAQRFKMSTGEYLFSLLSQEDDDIQEYLECDIDE